MLLGLLLLMHAVGTVKGVNFTQCLIDVVANADATQNLAGLLNGDGDPVSNASDATSISYALCTTVCGTGQESFQWSVFSQDFGAWLLPNLALISQLPFGARNRLDNFMSAVLTVGSPVLAGYSLFITLLNSVWINRLFDQLTEYPSSPFPASILNSLQQVPLRLDLNLVKSLIVLPENDCWLKCFTEFVDYTHTWSFASAIAIAWVVVAFIISVANSPLDVFVSSQADGDATGSLWLWLIPIVVGWLQLSPKCDFDRIKAAYKLAGQHAHGCTHMGASTVLTRRALTIATKNEDVASPDEFPTPPVFNYSRSFKWASTAYMMFLAFEASEEARNLSSPIPIQQFESSETLLPSYPPRSSKEIPRGAQYIHWAPGMFPRMAAASFASLVLQWGTAGAAFMTAWFTPTTRIGCRSLSYLIYAGLSTLIWMMLLMSSILAHYSVQPVDTPPSPDTPPSTDTLPLPSTDTLPLPNTYPGVVPVMPQTSHDSTPPFPDVYSLSYYHRAFNRSYGPVPVTPRTSYDDSNRHQQLHAGRVWARTISDWLRWMGKALAIANSIWVVAACTFVYSGFYDTCFCNSSVISRGQAAYAVIIETTAQAAQLKVASIGALGLACTSCFFFSCITSLMLPETRTRKVIS